ncbi:MAG: cupin domain-containing protein [Sandaracinaceae bacterium]|nr:cupin domain-containing protein [Sandaracinaceae bacterium]
MSETDDPTRVAAHLARNLLGLRHARGLTQEELSRAAGVPRSTIANLESGSGNPSLAVLVKVSRAVGAPIDELLASPRAKVRRWRHDELGAERRGRGVVMTPLVPEPVPEELLATMDFAPGAVMGGTPHLPGTREYFTLLAGEVVIVIAGEEHALAAGDVLAFPGNVPHGYRNASTKKPARGVSVVILAKAGV